MVRENNGVDIVECRCPACGGAVPVVDGRRRLSCPNCQIPLLALYDDYLPRYYFADKIGSRGAISLVRSAMGDKSVDQRSVRQISGVVAHLWWVPVYLFDGLVRSIQPGRQKRWKITSFSYYHSAAAGSPFGFEDIKPGRFTWPDLSIQPHAVNLLDLKREGTLLLPQHEDAAIDKELRQCWHNCGLLEPEILNIEKSIIYFPFWVVHYNRDGRRGFMVVNGVDGNIFRGALPAKRRPGLSLMTSAGFLGLFIGNYWKIREQLADNLNNYNGLDQALLMLGGLALFFFASYFVVVTKCCFNIVWENGVKREVRHGPIDPGDVALKQMMRIFNNGEE